MKLSLILMCVLSIVKLATFSDENLIHLLQNLTFFSGAPQAWQLSSREKPCGPTVAFRTHFLIWYFWDDKFLHFFKKKKANRILVLILIFSVASFWSSWFSRSAIRSNPGSGNSSCGSLCSIWTSWRRGQTATRLWSASTTRAIRKPLSTWHRDSRLAFQTRNFNSNQ